MWKRLSERWRCYQDDECSQRLLHRYGNYRQWCRHAKRPCRDTRPESLDEQRRRSCDDDFWYHHNYIYDTALNATDVPYGTKGFVTIKKGGDAAIYRVGQATDTGWTSGTIFQNSVGYKVGILLELRVPTILLPGVGVLEFP